MERENYSWALTYTHARNIDMALGIAASWTLEEIAYQQRRDYGRNGKPRRWLEKPRGWFGRVVHRSKRSISRYVRKLVLMGLLAVGGNHGRDGCWSPNAYRITDRGWRFLQLLGRGGFSSAYRGPSVAHCSRTTWNKTLSPTSAGQRPVKGALEEAVEQLSAGELSAATRDNWRTLLRDKSGL